MVSVYNLCVGHEATVPHPEVCHDFEMAANDPGTLCPEDSEFLAAAEAAQALGIECPSDGEEHGCRIHLDIDDGDVDFDLTGDDEELDFDLTTEAAPPLIECVAGDDVTTYASQLKARGIAEFLASETAAQRKRRLFEQTWEEIGDPKDVHIDRPVYGGQEVGGPRGAAAKLTPRSPLLRFFQLFWDDHLIEKMMVDPTNWYAGCRGARRVDKYPNFDSFTTAEIKRCLGFMIYQGCHPAPYWAYHFRDPKLHKVWGHEFLRNLFDKNSEHRFQEFRTFFHLSDPTAVNDKTDKLFKLNPLLRETRLRCERLWRFGKKGSVDEMTIGFKGRSAMKLRITYKAEGDGFQFDAICEDGYTYSWFSRHEKEPNMYKDCSPLHQRLLWLLTRLKINENGEMKKDDKSHDHTQIWMDNLYLSHRMCLVTGLTDQAWPPTGIAGPTRTNRGIPNVILQKAKTGKEEEAARGTLKIAIDKNKVLALSIYDNKPVHFLTTIDSMVEYLMIKSYKMWDPATGANVFKEIFRLNVINLYNHGMNSVDVADQLRNQYRIDHVWWRNNKWWWAIFIWLFGVVLVNSYVIYKRTCIQGGVKPVSHLEFRLSIAMDLMNSVHVPKNRSSTKRPASPATDSDATPRLRSEEKKPKKDGYVTAKRLANMEPWDGTFHRFEFIDNSSDTRKNCCMCKQYLVEAKDPKTGKKVQKTLLVRGKLTCTTCHENTGLAAHFCSPECFDAFPAHQPASE